MDTNLVLRAASAGNLTGDSTLSAVLLGPQIERLYLNVIVPSVSSGDTLIVKAVFRNSSTTTLQQTWSGTISAAGHYAIPIFCDHPDQYDLVVTLDTTADTSAPISFGAVIVHLSNSRKP